MTIPYNLIHEINATGGVPSDIILIPAPSDDGHIHGRDGRWFRNDSPEAVIAIWENNKVDIQGDYDHRSEMRWENDTESCGWIKKLYVKDKAIWATVEWTPEAQQKIKDRHYRYISPAFFTVEETRNIVELTSFALTNRPNFELKALNRAEPQHSNHKEDDMKNLHMQLCIMLGLAEGTSEADLLAKVQELNTKQPETNSKDPNNSVETMPKADWEMQKNRADAAEQKLADKETAELNAQAEAAVDAAIEAKAIAPASRDYHLNNMNTAESIEAFKKTYEGAEPIVGGTPALNNADATGTSGLTDEERKTYVDMNMADMGVSEEDYAKQLNAQQA